MKVVGAVSDNPERTALPGLINVRGVCALVCTHACWVRNIHIHTLMKPMGLQ